MDTKFINTQGEVQLTYLFDKFKSSFKYVLAVTMVTFLLVYGLSAQLLKPSYSNTATLIANYEGNTEDTGVDEINAARSLANIYATLIESNDVMFAVINDLDLDTNPKDLALKIDTEVQDSTPLIIINYSSKDAAKPLAVLKSVLNTEVVENLINAEQLTVLSEPSMETQIELRPSKIKNALVFSVLAGILSMLVLFGKELFNNKIQSSKQLKAFTTIPLIGLLGSNSDETKDSYLDLRTKLLFTLKKGNIKKVSFTSPQESESLSTLIHYLAKKVNELSDKVLIIDLAEKSNATEKTVKLNDDLIMKIKEENYADIIYLNESEISKILHNRITNESMSDFEEKYDYVFVNSGSINNDSNSLIMSQLANATVLLIDKNKVSKDDLYFAAQELDTIGNEILGLIFKS